MEINRAYLGYKYNMSENFSGKINVDVGDPDVSIGDTLKGKTNSHYTAFLKNAYATYKYGKLTVDAGMIPINQFLLSDDIWAHRYIMKPFHVITSYSIHYTKLYESTNSKTLIPCSVPVRIRCPLTRRLSAIRI